MAERALGKKRAVLCEVKAEDKPGKVEVKGIPPGKVPERLGGKKSKCFEHRNQTGIGLMPQKRIA